jgi:hypothetical protein
LRFDLEEIIVWTGKTYADSLPDLGKQFIQRPFLFSFCSKTFDCQVDEEQTLEEEAVIQDAKGDRELQVDGNQVIESKKS